jgi:SAM-dependent methyltransferase
MVHAPDRAQVALGNPSYVWRFGQDRRLTLIRNLVSLEDARILDVGCGVGTYVRKLREFSPHVVGIDIDPVRLRDGARETTGLILAASESLPFPDGTFDLVLLNEVIEHVRDDRRALEEATRVTRRGGHIVVFAPNRWFPFETHGVYIGRRFVFGNIPLVNYLPDLLRDRLVPHARAYTGAGIERLIRGLDTDVVERTRIYPGFDNITARRRWLGRLYRAICYRAERTWLRTFGLSHFVVLRRRPSREELGDDR